MLLTLPRLITYIASPLVLVVLLFFGLYAFVAYSGFSFARHPDRSLGLRIAYGIQIPWFSFRQMIGYRFFSAFGIPVGIVNFGENDWRLSFGYVLGSRWQVAWNEPPWGAGINLSAVIIVLLLLHWGRKHREAGKAPSTVIR